MKGHFDAAGLRRALRHAIARHRLQSTAQGLALLDDLTGLHTRRGFFHLGDQYMRIARRSGKTFSVVALDLDGFKQINDTFGHTEGNRALMDAAYVLRRCFRQSDILGRTGGDEFTVLITDAHAVAVETIANRLVREENKLNVAERPYQLTFSAGVVHSGNESAATLEELVAAADARLYEEKRKKSQDAVSVG